MKKNKFQSGIVLVNVLVYAVIVIIVVTALVNWASTMIKSIRQLEAREQAVQIAEAGIDYYRWHLAHAPTDYKDGHATTTNGPFIHDFKDKDGNVIGHFSLNITPPPLGSTIVRIRSTGSTLAAPDVSRTVQVSMAIPSFARFAVVANEFVRFGEGTEVFGPIHSNEGIRFDGLAHNVVTSSKEKFVDPDLNRSTWYQHGVYTSLSPGDETNNDSTPPKPVPNRPDVFEAGRQFPVPVVDFVGITTDLAQMKADAIADGKYLPSSGKQGYLIVLKINDTFDVYKINSLRSTPSGCSNAADQDGWGTWSIGTNSNTKSFVGNYPMPENGIIFVEDHVWVQGQINTARVTIAAGRFPASPSNWRNIIIGDVRGHSLGNFDRPADLLYTNYDGQDTIALIAQGNINVPLFSDDDLQVDGALIAQNGRVGRHYYGSNCDSGSTDWYRRGSITLVGMIGTNGRYGFAYTDNTGYDIRNITYDGNLLYAPPPSFPLTSNQYTTLSWEEIE